MFGGTGLALGGGILPLGGGRRRHREYIEELIGQYFEGITSLEEEEILRKYFHRGTVPEEWKAYPPMFRYFAEERRKIGVQRQQICPIGRWAVAAAVGLSLFFGWRVLAPASGRLLAGSVIYVDGRKSTDGRLIRTETLRALENLSEGEEEVYRLRMEALEPFFSNHSNE
jgi:hypothetical protein